MSLRRRLLLYLLVCAPLVWALALWVSADRARHEVNELFDTEIIRLARQVQATLRGLHAGAAPIASEGDPGEADVRDLAVAVWDREGRLLLADREGVELPRRTEAVGFVDLTLGGEPWRVYYLQSQGGDWLVAAGQKVEERDELVFSLTSSQLAPWLLVLPLLLLAMAWAVRRAMAPLSRLSAELARRSPDELQPLEQLRMPQELQPLLGAMNGLFLRIEAMLQRERRFTADAAHELRTPLAVLRAQWDVLRRAADPVERAQAEERLGSGLERMDRLVTQMLALARLESGSEPARRERVDWRRVAEQVVGDMLPLAERRRVELVCEWPQDAVAPLPLAGDADLLAVLLRNLLDNALRYGPVGGTVWLRFGARELRVENEGESLDAAHLARLGERFYRPDGQAETGSGLGISIAQRIAALHGLRLSYSPRADGHGTAARLSPA
ncbi:two-component sensor histidine kinase [Roseateles sp. DAIF2]|uniref:ATP-binding protein n=1 Tax=Roseateles sp. DAIF2 TaxID=2714952 RepID=UPI0018A2E34B|nr:ATP-binding protein [Roseateles sp. DAIF2]QPF73508.1 two-component sensor histidine kinase [Roseateles sp. DAIF2]